MDLTSPSVSVVINTLDRAPSLERTLSSLGQLRYPTFEVIVVRGPCTDRTDEVLQRCGAGLRIATCAYANLAMSRNIGLALAGGRILAFLDDDTIPEPDWLDHLVAGFADPRVAAVGGFIRDQSGTGFHYRTIVANRFAEIRRSADPDCRRSPGEYLSPTGANFAVRREFLSAIGGFDEEYAFFLEETDVNLRLHERGWTLIYQPDAEVHHKHLENSIRCRDGTPRSLYRIARSKAYFAWVHGRGYYPQRRIQARVAAHRARQHRLLLWLQLKRRMTRARAAQLLSEFDRGINDGREIAGRAPASPGHRPNSATQAGARAFCPFKPPRPPRERLRICFLLGADVQHSGEFEDRLYRAACELAVRGHEVTVMCLAAGRRGSIDFRSRLWVHRLSDAGPFTLARGRWKRLCIAARREIARIQARRQFQLIVAPPEASAALTHLAHMGIAHATLGATQVAPDVRIEHLESALKRVADGALGRYAVPGAVSFGI